MPILSAEIQFRKGLVALADGDAPTACDHFQTAIRIERQRAVARPQMRYLSYYGLTLAMSHGATTESIRACELAVRRDFFNPDLFLNLGRVYLLADKTTRALEAFERGLKLARGHASLRSELARADRRHSPPLSVLPRHHALNKILGRLRSSFRPRNPRQVRAVNPESSKPA